MLPEGYEIRLGTLADCAALPAIELAAAEMFRPFGILSDENGPDLAPVEYLEDQCREGRLWVVTHEGKPVGFGVADIRGGDFYIAELDVHPDHGRKGIGRALMKRICADAFERGAPRITLCTDRDVPWNAPFYATLGFREIAEADWTEWMHNLARHQTENGLDMTRRCYMELLRGRASSVDAH